MSDLSPQPPYYLAFLDRVPPQATALSSRRRTFWHLSAGITIGLGLWYLNWRWTSSINLDAIVFSIMVATAETFAFVGTLIFFFNIWDEGDTPAKPVPQTRTEAGLEGEGILNVDVFITTYDEDPDLVELSVNSAKQLNIPENVNVAVYVLDDGNRIEMQLMADTRKVGYLGRDTNRGFKAGNLANALFSTEGDFVVICDADTQLFPNFLEQTLGYFRDPSIAWVQTPHWFYDIPEGITHESWLTQRLGKIGKCLAPLIRFATGRKMVGQDPFLSEPSMFFDVIQRRRNRHSASFCCGAGSIHRREAVFSNALQEQGYEISKAERRLKQPCAQLLLPQLDMQPFKYHVSEDIFTSLQLHSRGWKSVYHPEVLARMLSPWTMHAWAMQKLKYAGGTYDIMLRTNLVFRSGLPWQARLHYLATYWSYLSALWVPILFLAPVFSLFTGIAPVTAYSVEFFLHLVPLLVMNELAMSIGCKGHDIHAGRILSLTTLHIQWRALGQVLMGKKPHFPPTPKNPMISGKLRHASSIIPLLGLMLVAAAYGVFAHFYGSEAHSESLVLVNVFWLMINALALLRVIFAAVWQPRMPDGSLLKISTQTEGN